MTDFESTETGSRKRASDSSGDAHQKRRPLWRQAVMIWIIVAVTAVWFLGVQSWRGLTIAGLVRGGALDWPDVMQYGEWWRIFTAMFVHMSLTHIAVNMVSLVSLYIVEWILGRWYFLTTYLVSGVVGNLLSLWLAPHNEVAGGASGAIFGIFGVALYLSIRGILTKSARNQLIIMLVLNLVYGFTSTDVGNMAHIGGLVAGVAMGALFVKKPIVRVSRIVRWTALGLSIITVIALAMSLPGYSPALGDG